MKLKVGFLIFLLTCLAQAGFGQAIVASLDPTEGVTLPAASAWRSASVAAVNLVSGKKDGDMETTISGSGVMGAYWGESFAAEVGVSNLTFDGDGSSGGGNFDVTLNATSNNIMLAYVFAESYAVGIGQSSFKLAMDLEGSSWSMEQVSTAVSQMLSLSVKLGDIFYVGGGLTNNTKTGNSKTEGFGSPTDQELVENSWSDTTLGLAVLTGKPGDFQFGAEVSMVSSPASEKAAEGDKAENHHKKSDTTNLTLELKFSDYLLGYSSTSKTEAEIADAEDGEEETTTTGVVTLGWTPQEGLTITASSETEKEVTKKTDGDEESTDSTIYLKVGYVF